MYFFSYKYAIIDQNETTLVGWERGIDRIADLEIMPDSRVVGKELDAAASNAECLFNQSSTISGANKS